MVEVVLGLGSNAPFGEMSSLEILKKAVCDLKKILKNVSVSSVYRTKPKYFFDQADFFNMAVFGFVEDDFSAVLLLKAVNEIEAKYGRNRKNEIRNGPRTLDIDIEIFGSEKIATETLTVPHPRLNERAFVLVPILEIFRNSADYKDRENFKLNFEEMFDALSDEEKKSVVMCAEFPSEEL